MDHLTEKYHSSEKRATFPDYDGTLTDFRSKPNDVKPDEELHKILFKLEAAPQNVITIIRGKDRNSVEKWFEGRKINLLAEHALWLRKYQKEREMPGDASDVWKTNIRPTLETFADQTPGSFIEEKNYSLVWHFRKAEPEQGELRANELKDELTTMIANHNLEILEGNKVIEVKSGGINKGIAAMQFLQNQNFDFVIAVEDDWTDEYMFRNLPESAYAIKVGLKNTAAKYKVESVNSVRQLLRELTR